MGHGTTVVFTVSVGALFWSSEQAVGVPSAGWNPLMGFYEIR